MTGVRRHLSILLVGVGVLLTLLAAWTAWSSGRGVGELGAPAEPRGSHPLASASREAPSTTRRTAVGGTPLPSESDATLPQDDVPAGPPTRGADGRYAYARLLVVDQMTGVPLADVRVVRGTSGAELGRTGASGRIALRQCLLGELVFACDGYLVSGLEAHGEAWAAADPLVARGEEARVALLADQFTVALQLHFLGADGQPAAGVRFSVRQLDQPPVSSLAVPRLRFAPGAAIPPEFTRAWNTHVRYTRLGQFTSAGHHYGLESEHEVFTAPAGSAELRLIALGAWQVTAVAAAGARGDGQVVVASLAGAACTVALQPGRVLRGRVLAADDRQPVAGAQVAVTPPSLLLAPATTDADGRFQLDGLAGTQVQLDVRGEGFEAQVVGPLPLGGDAHTLLLARRATVRMFGRVVQRGSGRPVAGAVVTLEGGRHARSDQAGGFALDVPLQNAVTLEIAADGHEPYVEQLDSEAGALPAQFELLPRDVATQVQLKLVSRLRGVVVDRAGQPVAGALVDLQPMVPAVAGGVPGRMVVRGGVPADVRRVTSDAQGRFELLTPLTGAMVLATHDHGVRIDTPLSLAPGSDRDGLQLVR